MAQARYDEFAEWYEQWIGDAPPLIASHPGLLPAMTGDRVLDIACGQGRMSRYLARSGADVSGIDISGAMLGKARAAGPQAIPAAAQDGVRHAGDRSGGDQDVTGEVDEDEDVLHDGVPVILGVVGPAGAADKG